MFKSVYTTDIINKNNDMSIYIKCTNVLFLVP